MNHDNNQNIYHIQLLNDLHNWFPNLLYHPQRFENVQDVLGYIIEVANQNPYTRGQSAYNNSGTPPQNNYGSRPSTYSSTTSSTSTSQPSSSSSGIFTTTTTTYSSAAQPTSSREASQPSSSSSSSSDLITSILNEMGNSVYNPSSSSSSSSSSSILNEMVDSVYNPLLSSASYPSSRLRVSMPLSNSGLSSEQFLTQFLGSMLGGAGGQMSYYSTNLDNFLEPVIVRPTQQHLEENTVLTMLVQSHPDNCAICQDPIENNQTMRTILYCGHSFHQSCIDVWFNESVRCPTCRHDIRESL